MSHVKVNDWVGNLVKHDGEYWVTLSNLTDTRGVDGYSNLASVKAAVRSLAIRINPHKYKSFRGERALHEIVKENKGNSMFNPQEFEGHTRTALIHWSLLDIIEDKFPVSSRFSYKFSQFKQRAKDYMTYREAQQESSHDNTIITQLKEELQKLDSTINELQVNRDKIHQAIEVVENIENVRG